MMPNWCECKLTVEGPFEQLHDFRTKSSGIDNDTKTEEKLIFQNLVPYPKGKWDYDWCVKNWGTKWGACNTVVKEGKKLTYEFQTAWSPPETWIRKVSKIYPALEFKLWYWEGGMGFKGITEFQGGMQFSRLFSDKYRGGKGG
jgi:hypothetical protein